MNIILYNYTGERNRVNKTSFLHAEAIYSNCNLKESTSIINPSILLGGVVGGVISEHFYQYNYCYIPSFNRYYFVDDIILETNNVYRLNLSVDVLMSYRSSLSGQKALISRNQYIQGYENYEDGGYQIDNRMPFKNTFNVEFMTLENYFPVVGNNDRWYCLTYFQATAGWVPTGEDTLLNPYGTFSHTVLLRVDNSKGASGLLGRIISIIATDYEKVGSFVVSMFGIPFTPRGVGSVRNNITIGTVTIDASSYPNEYIYDIQPDSNYKRLTIENPKSITSYIQITPYTEYKVFLPFIGLVDIPIEAFYNQGFKVFLDTVFDYTLGTITYRLMYSKINNYGYQCDITFYEMSAECMNPIPVSTSNAGSVNRAKDAYLASFIGGMVSDTLNSALKATAGFVTENPIMALSGLTNLVTNTITQPIKAHFDLKRMVPSGTIQKSASVYSSFKVESNPAVVNGDIGLVTITREPLMNNDEYYRLNGHVCQVIKPLSEVYGYTEIADIHLEIPQILTEESDMLISLLSSGVIFPDPPTTE